MSKGYAIFVDGPHAGNVMRYPGTPSLITAEHVDYASVPIQRFDAPEALRPKALATRRSIYRQVFRDPLPFGYVPYMLEDGGPFTAVHADAATRMVELLVEQRHAESAKTLVEGYQRTTSLLTTRLAALEKRLSAVMANHGLTDAVDEHYDEDDDEP